MKSVVDMAFETNIQDNDATPWGVYMTDEGAVHVMPEYGPEHEQNGECWCHPEIGNTKELASGEHREALLVHNVAQ